MATDRLADAWCAEAHRRGSCDREINEAMTNLTLEIIYRAMFDIDPRREATELAGAVHTLSEVAFYEMQAPLRMPRWWPSSFRRRKARAIRVLDEFAWGLVRTLRAEGRDHGDLLSMLLTAVDEDGHSRLTDKQVRDEALTLMLAGHDTSAAALDWIWFLIATHPEVAQRCRDELDGVLVDRLPNCSDVPHLTHIEAVIKESLRLYPPAIGVFLRQAVHDLVIGGYDVPRGSLLTPSSVVTHRDPRWFPDPDRFEPERFLAPRVERIPPGAYFPFGLGPRVCIGQAFATTEMVLIVATLLRRLDISMLPGSQAPQPTVHVALRPRDPLWLRWTAR